MGILDGRIAVITGGTRGFGLAVAEAYIRAGAAVVVASRSATAVQSAVQTLTQAGGRAAGMACDVSSREQVEALAQLAISTFGRFDIWMNNAGVSAPYGPTVQVPVEAFEKVIQTNIVGTYYGSITALRHYLTREQIAGTPLPKLINILGRGDRNPTPMQNAYASSKAWMFSFTRSLAKENAAGRVGIFAFNPGMMETEMLGNVQAIIGYEDRMKPLETVMRMWAKPAEVPAEKAVRLASSATDGRTGLYVREMTGGFMLGGAVGEGVRRITGKPGKPVHLEITSVPAALEDDDQQIPEPPG